MQLVYAHCLARCDRGADAGRELRRLLDRGPTGTTLTFQAVILDPAATSAQGASLTNAVMVEVLR